MHRKVRGVCRDDFIAFEIKNSKGSKIALCIHRDPITYDAGHSFKDEESSRLW